MSQAPDNKPSDAKLISTARYALAFLWIFSALTSVFFAPQIGYDILAKANIIGPLADLAIYGGGFADLLLGLWLLSTKQLRLCCLAQITLILSYTLLLSMIDASYWLHPFGPVTKNIPVLVLILFVYQSSAPIKKQ
jgi:hypothetical protein